MIYPKVGFYTWSEIIFVWKFNTIISQNIYIYIYIFRYDDILIIIMKMNMCWKRVWRFLPLIIKYYYGLI